MNQSKITYSVFTKPWKTPVPELGEHIRSLGFEGIELPVRPGFQVEPQNVRTDLPRVARQLADFGLKITSVAGPAFLQATRAAPSTSSAPSPRQACRCRWEVPRTARRPAALARASR